MKYESADAMRADLSKIITDDPELIEATIKQYFEKARPLPAIKVIEPKRVSGAARGPWGSHSEEGLRAARMRESSSKLGMAIDAMLSGREFQTSEKLQWSGEQKGELLSKWENSHLRKREAKSVANRQAERKQWQEQIVDTSVPCYRCGAARGCGPKRCGPVNVSPEKVNRQWDKEAGHI